MGRTITPTYRVEVENHPGIWRNYCAWDSKSYGRACHLNLERWRATLNASFNPTGVNAHIGSKGRIYSVRLVRQSTGQVVAAYYANTFPVS